MRRRDLGKLLAICAAASLAVPRKAFAQTCNAGNGEATAAETAAGARIVDASLCPGDWRRYGADPSGQADSTAAIQAACNCNELAFDTAGGTYLVAGNIRIPSGVTVRGASSAATTVTCVDGGRSIFVASGASGVVVENLKLMTTSVSAKAHTGAVEFFQSTKCSCNQCEIIGCNWAGVLIHGSTRCTVNGCHFHDFAGSVQDSADVCVYDQSHSNVIVNNRCSGGNWHGIAIQDPYNNSLPSNNQVRNNIVGQHKAYGIMVYMPSAGNSYNQITGNSVQDIQGSVLENNAGAGIYVVGAGAGGTSVTNNTVRNCCVQTKQQSLAPAGIGIAGISASAAPVNVSGNTVSDMRAHDAILIVSSKGPVTVSGNTASSPAGNPASPIRIDATSNVTVSGNSAARDPGTVGRCIFVHANAIAISNISITGNSCFGGTYPQIELLPTDGGSISDVLCTDNVCQGSGANSNCIRLVAVGNARVSGNKCLPGH
jgi:parallel beta-helix repeat protein